MKRKPLHPRANAQTKAAGMPQTPPAATSPKPVIPTSTNAPDSTEARRARQWEMVQRIADLGLVIAFAGFIASGVTHCMDAARASKAAHAGSASNGIITTGTGLPCLVCSNTTTYSGSNPHRQAGFYHAQTLAGSGTPTASRYGYGRGALTRKDSGTAIGVLLPPRPPVACSNAAVGTFHDSPIGI